MSFRVFAGQMYCGILVVNKGIHTFIARNTDIKPATKLLTYKHLSLRRFS